jgi:hypothetical protein
MAFEDFLNTQYQKAFGRPVSEEGLSHWGPQLASGEIPTSNFQSTLFKGAAAHPSSTRDITTTPQSSVSDFLERGYQEAFGRSVDPQGLRYWTPQLESGAVPRENFLQTLYRGAAAHPTSMDLENRTQYRPTGTSSESSPTQLFDVEDLVDRGIYNKSYSGLDPNSQLTQTLLPLITQQAQQLPGQAEDFTGTLQDFFKNLMRQSLGPQAFQGTLNQLAGRNVLNSSVASDALAKAQTGIASDIGQRGFEAQLAGLQQQMGVPTQLAQLLGGVGKISESQDPLGPYNLMARFLA